MTTDELLAQMKALVEAKNKTETPKTPWVRRGSYIEDESYHVIAQHVARHDADFAVAAHNAPLAEWLAGVERMAKERDGLLSALGRISYASMSQHVSTKSMAECLKGIATDAIAACQPKE